MKEEYTNFSMRITQAQKDIMDFVMDNILINECYKPSKASVVVDCFREYAINYLSKTGLPEEYYKTLNDEMLLGLLQKEKSERIKRTIRCFELKDLKKMLNEQIEIYKSNPKNKEDVEVVFQYFIEVIKEKEEEERK